MQFSLSALALVASIVSVHAESHSHLHQRAHAREVVKRSIQLNAKISVLPSKNSANVQEGKTDDAYLVNELLNNGTDSMSVVFWETDQWGQGFNLPISNYNANPATPSLTLELGPGESKFVSFSENFRGSYAPVYKDTIIGPGGNIQEAWTELTTKKPDGWTGQWGANPATVDVSYLPNNNGRMTQVEVDECTSNKITCAFTCRTGMTSCVDAADVIFDTCEQGAPWSKASTGTFAGAKQGGCMVHGTKKFLTTFASSQ